MRENKLQPSGGRRAAGNVLAVDCGGSHTRALLVDASGKVQQTLDAGAANFHTRGATSVARTLARLLAQAPEAERIAAGIAGLRGREDREMLINALGDLGVYRALALYPDTRIALRAGCEGDGVVLAAGTGASAYGRRGDHEARAGGWGSRLGDEGSGYWMVTSVLRHALRAHDEGDVSGTGLMPAMLRMAGLQEVDELRRLAGGEAGTESLSALLPGVAQLEREGNTLVAGLLDQAADELTRLVRLVDSRLGFRGGYKLVCAGGMMDAFPRLADVLQSRLGGEAEVRVLETDPAWGAYLLATEEREWRAPIRSTLPVTESRNPATEGIQSLSTIEVLRLMNAEDDLVPIAVRSCLPELALLADEAAMRLAAGGRLIFLGAGTSGRLAMLDAVECIPTFGLEPGRVFAIVAGGDAALTGAVEGAEDDADAGRGSMADAGVTVADVVVGVSASGDASFVRAGLASAHERGAVTALVTCNPASGSHGIADHIVAAVVGPEVIAGSSRLKAGTAQKLILNMLSTTVMVKLGRTAGNRMLGVRPTNEKLRRRAVRICVELSGTGDEEALAALESCNWDVALAVLALRTGDIDSAKTLLRESGEDLARALGAVEEREPTRPPATPRRPRARTSPA